MNQICEKILHLLFNCKKHYQGGNEHLWVSTNYGEENEETKTGEVTY